MFIRKAKLNDISKLAEIHVLAWQTAYAEIMSPEFLNSLSIEERTSDWQGWINEPGPGTTIVIENSAELTGFCVFGPSRDDDVSLEKVGEILALNVHPKFWRCGHGKILCKTAMNEARQRRWESLTLWVLKSNERARLFYQSLGFKLDGAERNDTSGEGGTLKEIRYGKTL